MKAAVDHDKFRTTFPLAGWREMPTFKEQATRRVMLGWTRQRSRIRPVVGQNSIFYSQICSIQTQDVVGDTTAAPYVNPLPVTLVLSLFSGSAQQMKFFKPIDGISHPAPAKRGH